MIFGLSNLAQQHFLLKLHSKNSFYYLYIYRTWIYDSVDAGKPRGFNYVCMNGSESVFRFPLARWSCLLKHAKINGELRWIVTKWIILKRRYDDDGKNRYGRLLQCVSTFVIRQKGYFGIQIFNCSNFGEGLTFCVNYDQKSPFVVFPSILVATEGTYIRYVDSFYVTKTVLPPPPMRWQMEMTGRPTGGVYRKDMRRPREVVARLWISVYDPRLLRICRECDFAP